MSGATETQTQTTTTALTGPGSAAAAGTVPPAEGVQTFAPGSPEQIAAEKAAADKAAGVHAHADKAAADKAAAEKAAAEKPAELEVKLPEGFAPDEAMLGEFKAAAKELKLEGPGAQKLVDFWAKAQTTIAERQQQAAEQSHRQWAEALKADKEFGGAQFDASVQVARKAMLKYGSPELSAFLNETGLGDHPELFRAFARVGKAMAEDSVAGARGNVAPDASEEALYQKLFPTMFKGEKS